MVVVGKDKASQPSAMATSLWVMMMAALASWYFNLVSSWRSSEVCRFAGELETDVAGQNGGLKEQWVGGWGDGSWSQLQPCQMIEGGFLMKGCNQVTHVNLPHPVRLTCQNTSLMTEGLVCSRTETMQGRAGNVTVTHQQEWRVWQLICFAFSYLRIRITQSKGGEPDVRRKL